VLHEYEENSGLPAKTVVLESKTLPSLSNGIMDLKQADTLTNFDTPKLGSLLVSRTFLCFLFLAQLCYFSDVLLLRKKDHEGLPCLDCIMGLSFLSSLIREKFFVPGR
jgi:hypothetical protein